MGEEEEESACPSSSPPPPPAQTPHLSVLGPTHGGGRGGGRTHGQRPALSS